MTTTTCWRFGRYATAAWAALSLGLFCASSLGVFATNTVVRLFTDVPHLVEMAEWSITWGLLGMLGVLISARLVFGRWLRVSAQAVLIGSSGIVLSAGFHVVLQQWSVTRFGEMDPDLIGLTSGLFGVLLGISTSAFGVFVAPRGSTQWPLAFVLAGGLIALLIVATNVPGITDGIDPESWPLAIWLGISAVYAAAVTLASVVKARAP